MYVSSFCNTVHGWEDKQDNGEAETVQLNRVVDLHIQSDGFSSVQLTRLSYVQCEFQARATASMRTETLNVST